MDQKKIGQFLKQLRNEKEMTQEQLAQQFSVSSRTVSRWETGSNLPDISLLVEIADFYDVDVREIIEGERKSEMMDKEIREVADKMADYADNEKKALKSKLWRLVQVLSLVVMGLMLLTLVIELASLKEAHFGWMMAIFFNFIVFILSGIIALYSTGLLQKMVENKVAMMIVKIITIVLLAFGTFYMIAGSLIAGLLTFDFLTSKIETCDDPARYNDFIHNKEDSKYQHCAEDRFDIFPEKITPDMKVDEFSFMYYNPWDPQYITYLTVEYDKDAYDTEIKRLEGIGVEEYEGIYDTTAEPDGYDLVSMDVDEYYGFVYAMVPEGGKDNKITYVGIWFCNYFLDVKAEKYIKEEYLLEGFDATKTSEYRAECLKKLNENAE